MAAAWPQWMTDSFLAAKRASHDPSAYNGSYTPLLYHLFGGIEGPFEIIPHYRIPQIHHNAVDIVAMFTVEHNGHPVLFIQVHPSSLRSVSERQQADKQIRDHFRDLSTNLITPRLPAICAFGTHIAFYEYTAATNTLTPPAIAPDPIVLNDVAPAGRWKYNVLKAGGITRMRQVAQDVRAMCGALNY